MPGQKCAAHFRILALQICLKVISAWFSNSTHDVLVGIAVFIRVIVTVDIILGFTTNVTFRTGTSKSSAPSASKTTCFICGKDISQLSDIRQSMHMNSCLDKEETSILHEKETVKWQSTYDCPLCGEALGPGPVIEQCRHVVYVVALVPRCTR